MTPGADGQCETCRLPLAPIAREHRNACPFCGRSFPRVDGARRHARTCRLKGDQPLPAIAKRGRKLRACDTCYRVKVSCDGKTPCVRCSTRGLNCVYGRFCADPSHRPAQARPSVVPPATTSAGASGSSRLMVPFLLNCTDPSVDSVNEILANEPERDSQKPTIWETLPLPGSVCDAYTINPNLLVTSFLDPCIGIPGYDRTFDDSLWDLAIPSFLTVDEGFAGRINHLLSALLAVLDTRPHLDDGLDQLSLRDFFTVADCQKFISAFYRRRHYHSVLIHWATLDLAKIAAPLLLALLLTGAAYSHCRGTNPNGTGYPKALHVLADRYIYSQLKKEDDENAPLRGPREKLELLQAAYMINYLLICRNESGCRRRVMTKRHTTLVTFLGEHGLASCRHSPDEDVDTFIYRESCIRLVTWTLLTDALLTLVLNKPPSMMLHDIACPLPCAEDIWDGDSPSKLDTQRMYEEQSWANSSLKSLLSGLLREEEPTDVMASEHRLLTAQHLHAVIYALQPMIFNWHTMLLPVTVARALLRALDRWKVLWNGAIDRIPQDQRQWLGVARYAPEIAWLSRRIVEGQMAGQDKEFKYLQRVTTYDLADFHHFIQTPGATSEAGTAGTQAAADGIV